MERRNVVPGDAGMPQDGEALEFVRFCHRRKRVGWPELYDEMCLVAGRGLYRGYGAEELAAIGIGFGLLEMQGLANLVGRVVAEDAERRRRAAESLRAAPTEAPPTAAADGAGDGVEGRAPAAGPMRLAVAAGA
jgi:hypothetical protein